jgi:hypothetical protein
MLKFRISCERLVGFAAETGEPGHEVLVLVNNSLTSEQAEFHVYTGQISDIFLAKIGVPPVVVVKALIILHSDNFADIYQRLR